MNKHLKDADNASLPRPPTSERPLTLPQGKPQRPYVNWLFVLGIIFGAYVYLGHNVLKKEYTWAHIRGTLEGRMESSAVRESTEAKAAQAAAIASAAATPEIKKAADIIRETTPLEAQRTREVGEAQAEVDIKRQRVMNDLEAARAAATKAATSYQECADRVIAGANSMMNAPSSDGDPTKFNPISSFIAQRDYSLTVGMEGCDQYKKFRDDAYRRADEATNALKLMKP